MIFHSLQLAPYGGWAFLDCGFFFIQPTLLLILQSCYHFLSYHSIISTVMLFDPSLLGLFGFTAYSSFNGSIWSLDSYSCYFGLFYYIACELHCPIYFFLGILGPFAFLRHPWPFFLVLCSHWFLLTLLGFPNPITLSFILGTHGLSIDPLLSLLALLQACCGPFSLFYITYCPWIYYFSLRTPLGSSAFLKAHLFTLWAYDPLLLPLGLNGFSIHSLTLPCLYCWASSFYQASQNEHQHIVFLFSFLIFFSRYLLNFLSKSINPFQVGNLIILT